MSALDDYGETIQQLSDFVKKLDESIRVEAFKFLLSRETSPAKPASAQIARAAISHSPSSDRPVAPQELIRKSGVSKFTDKAIVLAYWLEQYQQQVTFSSGDLKAAFEQAREPSPKNPSDLVANLEATGRVMRAEKAGNVQHYRLTSSAINEVERWVQTERPPHEVE
jgi:hypothetical protein